MFWGSAILLRNHKVSSRKVNFLLLVCLY